MTGLQLFDFWKTKIQSQSLWG